MGASFQGGATPAGARPRARRSSLLRRRSTTVVRTLCVERIPHTPARARRAPGHGTARRAGGRRATPPAPNLLTVWCISRRMASRTPPPRKRRTRGRDSPALCATNSTGTEIDRTPVDLWRDRSPAVLDRRRAYPRPDEIRRLARLRPLATYGATENRLQERREYEVGRAGHATASHARRRRPTRLRRSRLRRRPSSA